MTREALHPNRHLREVAFYYPGHLWESSDWVKNLLLFFDGIALLVPRHKSAEPELIDPFLATPLRREGLLHTLEPETIVDKRVTEQLADAMTEIIISGALDHLAKEDTEFHKLSYSRLGGFGDADLADMILEELQVRGLALDIQDGTSIPMHPLVRALILTLLVQILRPYGAKQNFELSPATDRVEVIGALKELLSLPDIPSSGKVVAFDMKTVGVDLSPFPIDEVLDFRQQHLKEHKAYALAVRRFVKELSLIPAAERSKAFEDRESEIEAMAHELKEVSQRAWRKVASFGLTIAGSIWNLATGNDPLGSLLAAVGTIVGTETDQKNEVGAYSYLFSARQHYG